VLFQTSQPRFFLRSSRPKPIIFIYYILIHSFLFSAVPKKTKPQNPLKKKRGPKEKGPKKKKRDPKRKKEKKKKK
jgi:hypothetical protein